MTALVPNRFLFRFELPIHRWPGSVRVDADLGKWDSRFEVPPLQQLEGQSGFGRVWMAWHESGLVVACDVRGKRQKPQCDVVQFRKSDHLRLMTDMRDARDIRRATRFCQQFFFMPTGGGKTGRDPIGGGVHVARAKEDAPLARPGDLIVAADVRADGYSLEALISARALAGYDPVEHPRIGFCTMLEDRELGQQALTVGDDLNWWYDPSTWVTGVLRDA